MKSTVAPGGVFFVPTSIKEGGYFNLSAGAGINFIWDDASQSAKVVSNGVGKYVNDSFFGIAIQRQKANQVENATRTLCLSYFSKTNHLFNTCNPIEVKL